MTEKRLIILFAGLFIIVMLLCCKKKENDYRDNYTGKYEFTVNESIYNFNDSTTFDTIVYYSGQITNGGGSNDIYICYLPNHCIDAILGENGILSKPLTSGLGWGFSGKFETNEKVSFEYYLNGTTHNVIGIKK